ncbi:WD40 repeat domain-containing protein, partial [Singulisphaera rosea]
MGTTRFRQEDMLSHISFSPDGRTLASTGWNGAVCFWDPKTGESSPGLEPLKEPNSALALAYSPDGTLLAVGRDQGVLQVWDFVAHRERFRASMDNKGRVQSLAFTPDGRTLASASQEETCVRLWDTATGKERRVLKFDDNMVFPGTLAISPDGARLALGTSPRAVGGASVRIWDLAGGDEPIVINDVKDSRFATLGFAKDGKTLVSGSIHFVKTESKPGGPKVAKSVCRICAWDVRDGRLIRTLEPGDGSESGFVISRDGTTLISGHGTELMIWDLATWRVRRTIPLVATNSSSREGAMALSPDGRTLAMLRSDHKIHMLD